MTSYLLCLADLEAAAPGILKVIFGSDGDFTNAPPFAAHVSVIKWTNHIQPGDYILVQGDMISAGGIWDRVNFENTELDAVALDLRIPTIASRIAGLCLWSMMMHNLTIGDATMEIFRLAVWRSARAYVWSEGHAASLGSIAMSLARQITAIQAP